MLCDSCGKEILEKENSCPFCGHEAAAFSEFEEWDDPERYLPEDDLESQIGLHMPKILLCLAAITAFVIFIASVVIYVRGAEGETPAEKTITVKLPDTAMSAKEYQEKYLESDSDMHPIISDDAKTIVLEGRQDVIERMIKNGNDAKEAMNLPPMPTESPLEPEGYILPESDSKILEERDLKWLSLELMTYAKNEIYARHGKRFNEYAVQGYFDSKTWYHGQYSPEEFNVLGDVLNKYEKQNLQLLDREIEKLKKKEKLKDKPKDEAKDKEKDKSKDKG